MLAVEELLASDAFFSKGVKAERIGSFDSALRHYWKSLKSDTRNVHDDAFYTRAKCVVSCLCRVRQFDEALRVQNLMLGTLKAFKLSHNEYNHPQLKWWFHFKVTRIISWLDCGKHELEDRILEELTEIRPVTIFYHQDNEQGPQDFVLKFLLTEPVMLFFNAAANINCRL